MKRCNIFIWRGKPELKYFVDMCYFGLHSKYLLISQLEFPSTEAQFGNKFHKMPCSRLSSQNKCGGRSVKRSISQTNFNKRKGHNWFLSLLCCEGPPTQSLNGFGGNNNGRNCSVVSFSPLFNSRKAADSNEISLGEDDNDSSIEAENALESSEARNSKRICNGYR